MYYQSIYEVPVTTMTGESRTLIDYQGQVLLIVNVASRCGFTPQYKLLESMYRDYAPLGFSVLGFPCDQFLNQEPGSHEEIKALATECYNVTFPLFAKIAVKGPEQAPLYQYLAAHIKKRPLKFIPWNFSKIIVNAKGEVLKQFWPTTQLTKIRKNIEDLLPKSN